jgi:hypothetical protein
MHRTHAKKVSPSNPLLVDIQERYLTYETKSAILNGVFGTNYTTEALAGQRLGGLYKAYHPW